MKKFYILTTILFALLGISQTSWANTAASANSSTDLSDGKIVMVNEHATFTFSGEGISDGGSWGYKLKSLKKGNEAIYSFTWTNSNSAYSLQVSSIAFEGRGYRWAAGDIGGGKMEFNGVEKQVASIAVTNNDGDYTKFSASGNLSSGMELICKNTNSGGIGDKEIDYYIRKIAITYTITPTGKPSTTEVVEATIDVTVDEANKQTVDLSQFFNMPEGVPADFAFGYELSGGAVDGNNFYATSAGTYTAKARIAAKADCHEQSDLSEGAVTITVNRLNQTLSWTNEEAIKTNIILGDEQTINATSTSGRAVTYTSGNTDVLTVDENGKLTAVAVGEATITVSRFHLEDFPCGQD